MPRCPSISPGLDNCSISSASHILGPCLLHLVLRAARHTLVFSFPRAVCKAVSCGSVQEVKHSLESMDIKRVEQCRNMEEFVLSLREDSWPQVRGWAYLVRNSHQIGERI